MERTDALALWGCADDEEDNMFVISRRDWELLQQAKAIESGDLSPLPWSDPAEQSAMAYGDAWDDRVQEEGA